MNDSMRDSHADWTIEKARGLYSMPHWSAGYFDVGRDGRLVARPEGANGPAVALTDVVERARADGLGLPLLVRFTDMLTDRARALCRAFDGAVAKHGYGGRHRAVYPIKVNQQRAVVAHILGAASGRVGLEAGSKPELIAALAMSPPGGTIVCNGYKDAGYVRLALTGGQLGMEVFLVVEKFNELPLILAEAQAMDVRPRLGVRMRLASLGKGNWQNSGGEKAKFGLSAAQLLDAVAFLRERGALDWLELLHFHMGSQIPQLRDIEHGAMEAARCYAELHALGAGLRIMDVGGGLGVDYEGTRSRSFCSMNYGLDEYANAIVGALHAVCEASSLPQPDLITESGRAMSAHHAVLVTEVLGVEPAPAGLPEHATGPARAAALGEMSRLHETLGGQGLLESYTAAREAFEGGLKLFVAGKMPLRERAALEAAYQRLCIALRGRLDPGKRAHRELLDELNRRYADKLFCNFSVFQSVPDVWAIEQIFPVVPLARLDERPARRGVIEDLTCDSDGRLDFYVDAEGIEESMPVHAIEPGERYLLGLFLVGAYQETLGDIHNLFGDTCAVDVQCRNGDFILTDPHRGDSAAGVLAMVGYDTAWLRACLAAKGMKKELVEAALGASTYLNT